MSRELEDRFDPNSYWTSQDFETSARLHLQHWIWSYQLGFHLHPKIDAATPSPLRIADVAAGNAAWLLDTARSLPSDNLELVGFDITSSNFPAAEYLPSNMRLQVWDAFSQVPDQYVGYFDIVHIRAIYSAVRDNNVAPLLANLVRMLKPGGYLQWDESDASTLSCRVPNSGVKADATRTIVKLQSLFSAQSKLSRTWLHNFPATLQEHECEIVTHQTYEPRRELARAWTDNMLLVWRGVISMVPETAVPMPPGMGLPDSISRKTYAELLVRAVEETSKGAAVGMTNHVFVARKAA